MFRNKEGYADPTAGAALKHIAYAERIRKKKAYKRRLAASRRRPYNAIIKKPKSKHKNEQQERIKWLKALRGKPAWSGSVAAVE